MFSCNETCDLEKQPLRKYLFGELSFGDLSVKEKFVQGIFRLRKYSLGNCPRGKWTIGELSKNQIDLNAGFSVILNNDPVGYTAQKIKFCFKDCRNNWLHLLKKYLMENFIFCAVLGVYSPCAWRPHPILEVHNEGSINVTMFKEGTIFKI